MLKENIFKSKILFNNLGDNFFLIGTFFLSSALPISLFFLLGAILIAIVKYKKEFLLDKFNYILLVASIFLIISSIFSSFHISSFYSTEYVKSSNWLAILNWIPLFIGFRAFQFYLRTKYQKEKFIKFLIAGTFPIIFSMIMQYFFNIFGPFSIFDGLIIWFQKPLVLDNRYASGGVAGLFSNPNYTAYWLSCIFPFSIYIFKNIKDNKPKKIFLFSLIISLVYFIILTDSRGGLLSIMIALPFMIGIKICLFFIISFILIFWGYSFLKFYLSENIVLFFESLFERSVFWKLSNFNILNIRNFTRIDLFIKTILLIAQKPLFGWMAGSFSVILFLNGELLNIQHAHNMPLQLAYDFGILPSLLICSVFVIILYKSFIKIIFYQHKNFLNKTWFTASLISVFFHFFDMPYYDGKLAILFWMLIAGLKSTFIEKNNNHINLEVNKK